MLAANEATIEQVAERIAEMQRACCMTGAGISAESGVPTFRGAGGLWDGQRAEELATPEAFARDPQRVWAFYNHRRSNLRTIKPNPAHYACVELEDFFQQWWLISQNVDGLHRQAGSRSVVELHGNIWTVRCTGCAEEVDKTGESLPETPLCASCGALLRPAAVWFGEALPETALRVANQAVESCQVMLVVGTSSVVQPAASMAHWAQARGADVVEVNLEPTPLSDSADACLFGPAGQILPALVLALRNARRQPPQQQ